MVRGPGPVDVRNQGIVWEPGTGPGESYSKIHPVPFGEYIPMRAQLARLFERLDQIPRDMVPGTEPGLLDLAGTTVGDVICFEVAWDGVVHDLVDGGAELLVVQTNNATYMGTGQVEQQFAIARLRAVEVGRYVAVVATNGVSGIVAPDGSRRRAGAGARDRGPRGRGAAPHPRHGRRSGRRVGRGTARRPGALGRPGAATFRPRRRRSDPGGSAGSRSRCSVR